MLTQFAFSQMEIDVGFCNKKNEIYRTIEMESLYEINVYVCQQETTTLLSDLRQNVRRKTLT